MDPIKQALCATGRSALDEIWSAVEQLDADEVTAIVEALATANKVVLHGLGREGIMMRALAMRLYHLGLDVHVLGDMTAPPVGENDLLLVSAGPGYFSTIDALANIAKNAGAKVVCVTSLATAMLPAKADLVLTIPAQTMANDEVSGTAASVLPMGSLFEGALFIYSELIILEVQKRLKVPKDEMRLRHTNLE